jgi:hypothetical protein
MAARSMSAVLQHDRSPAPSHPRRITARRRSPGSSKGARMPGRSAHRIAAAPAAEPKAPEAKAGSPSPQKWWQWLIVYPTLATSIIAGLPTFANLVKSVVYGFTPGLVSEAERQNALWIKNKDCLMKATPVSIRTPQSFEVAATVCMDGDILLSGKRSDADAARLTWVPMSDVVPVTPPTSHASAFSIFSEAVAGERRSTMLAQDPNQKVLCQRWLEQGRLLQRVQTGAGCFDQVVDTFHGQVVSRNPAPCTPQC